MVVGTSKYCHLSLSNPGPCDLKYSLHINHQKGDIISGSIYITCIYLLYNCCMHSKRTKTLSYWFSKVTHGLFDIFSVAVFVSDYDIVLAFSK